jgi:1-acyl-sn-glycerol-3-phosphate acyltransferase
MSAAAKTLLSKSQRDRLAELAINDAGHGYDVLGLHRESVAAAVALLRPVYDLWFRVESNGSEHVPKRGAAILAANHSGMLPIDAAMIMTDVLLRTTPPRVPRSVGDGFIPFLPLLGTVFSRVGMVSGSRGNFRHLLETDELVLVFPEGVPGIAKGFRRRYQLAEWRLGHVELAILHRAPVIPVAVIGAEESWIQLGKIQRLHPFGAPFLPIPLTPLPLPVRYHIAYGDPIHLHERFKPDDALDPEVARSAADLVKGEVARLIEHGLRRRKGLFR